MSGDKKIRIGSRKSELALIQTRHVISLLSRLYPDKEFEIVTMSTLGDKVLDIPLPKIGEKSLFTKELETALATGCVDFVVHSLKDLPTVLPEGMAIGAVLKREDPRDALVVRKDLTNKNLSDLANESVIGTSSLRRTAQLSRKYPNLKVENIRGNLNTRLKKLDEFDKYHAIVLAYAGLTRMGWHTRVTKVLDCEEMMYAVGQGALAVECRENNLEILNLLQPLHDPDTVLKVVAERSFLKTLGGGCSAPVAVSTVLKPFEDKYSLTLIGGVWSLNGKTEIIESDKCTVEIKKEPSETIITPEKIKCPMKRSESDNNTILDEQNNVKCVRCSYEIPCKRQKLDDNNIEKNNSKSNDGDNKDTTKFNLLNDPHEHCPVTIPIGADFMGKCPYLDAQGTSKCPVNAEILTSDGQHSSQNITKCPFLSKAKVDIESEINNEIKNDDKNNTCPNREQKLYVGIYTSKQTPLWALEQAEHLGINLAEKLMKKGALEVMHEAQKEIRGN